MTTRRLVSACLQGLVVFLTALMVYQTPPDAAAYFQPALQGALAVLSALGVGAAVRRVG